MSDVPELLKPLVPNLGDVWLWEPEKPHARESVVVTEVKWNGEEVWIECRGVSNEKRTWNDLSRWVEATVLQSVAAGYE